MFGSLSGLGFGEVVGEFGDRLADLVEDVEQDLLALDADTVGDLACDLLHGGQHFVEGGLCGRGEVDEHAATVVAVSRVSTVRSR